MRRRTLFTAAASASIPFLGSKAFALEAGVGEREIVIGQSAVTSGQIGVPMQGFNAGAQLAFDTVNSRGGIHGRLIRYISLDDGLSVERTVANYKVLLAEHRVFAFFGAIGTGNTAAVVPILRESNTPLIGSSAVGDSAREKAADAAYFIRAGYGREAERTVQHLLTMGVSRIAVAHFAVPGGVEVLASIRMAVKAQNPSLDVVQSAGVNPNGSDVVEAGIALGKGGAQAIIMFLSGTLVAELIRAVQNVGGTQSFYGFSIVAGDVVAKSLGSQLRGLVIAQVVPSPWNEADSTSRDFRQRCAAQKVPVNYSTYEGYINGSVLIEALRRTGSALTRANLHATMRGFKARIGGMDLDFTSGKATGSNFVELVHVRTDGRFVR